MAHKISDDHIISMQAATIERLRAELAAKSHIEVKYESDSQIDDILADDTAHNWLKDCLMTARHLDPIDVASDAEFLCSFLDSRARKILSE